MILGLKYAKKGLRSGSINLNLKSKPLNKSRSVFNL